jgi:hypothetical protein
MHGRLPYPEHLSSQAATIAGFVERERVPHLAFCGPHGSGKTALAMHLIDLLYKNNKTEMRDHVLLVQCTLGKGIQFVRDELKLFAKSQVRGETGSTLKCAVLLNGDSLTTDAQSALRRCIETFSHTTRFIVTATSPCKLLRPIRSRLCEVYCPQPRSSSGCMNLHAVRASRALPLTKPEKARRSALQCRILKIVDERGAVPSSTNGCFSVADDLYQKGCSGEDVCAALDRHKEEAGGRHSALRLCFGRATACFRDERLLIAFMLDVWVRGTEKEELATTWGD